MSSTTKNPVVLLVGRLSGPKNDVLLNILRQVAPQVANQIPGVRFEVVGGPVGEEHRLLEKEMKGVRFHGHQKNLKPFYQKATVVVGAGRVALEAMVLKKPVVAVGERLYVGPILPGNVESACATNFGDCKDRENFDWAKMAKDLVSLLRNSSLRDKAAKTGYDLVQSEYNMAGIYPKMEDFYRKVLLEKNLSFFREIPVLMYHRVLDKEPAYSKFNLHVTTDKLEKQFLFLKARGFEAVGFEDLMTRKITGKPVILTFDDGYEDNYRHLFPLLLKHRLKAVVYLLGNRKHKNNFWDIPLGEPEAPLLKENQIKEMAASGFVEFGAHSMNHAKLTLLKPKEIEKEVVESKKSLEKFLGREVVSFAYPYGMFNDEIKRITAQAGFTFGIATNRGPTRFGKDLMEIHRVYMSQRVDQFNFFKKTSGFYLRYRKMLGRG